jgi:hypothetical protein
MGWVIIGFEDSGVVMTCVCVKCGDMGRGGGYELDRWMDRCHGMGWDWMNCFEMSVSERAFLGKYHYENRTSLGGGRGSMPPFVAGFGWAGLGWASLHESVLVYDGGGMEVFYGEVPYIPKNSSLDKSVSQDDSSVRYQGL